MWGREKNWLVKSNTKVFVNFSRKLEAGLQTEFMPFWRRIRNECTLISDLYELLPFCTTYLCEAASLKLIKIRSFLKNVENVLRPPLSCINLRVDNLC